MNPGHWQYTAYVGLIGGLGLFIGLIVHQGLGEVMIALAVAGWGLLAVALFHLLPMIADTLAWHTLLEPARRLPLRTMLRARWIGESVNGLLPVAQVGGDLVKARLIARCGVPGPLATASVVVDLTIAVFTQIVFTLLGLGLLLWFWGGGELALAVVIGAGFGTLLLAGFHLAQRHGLFTGLARGLERIAGGRAWLTLVGGARSLDTAVIHLYGQRRRLARACCWRLSGWLVGAGEVWLALYFLGYPVNWLEALLLESLGQAVRAAGFAVPGALGVQEGGYLALGTALGLTPEVALALSLSKRVREWLLGVPGLIAWQLDEGRRLWKGRSDNDISLSRKE